MNPNENQNQPAAPIDPAPQQPTPDQPISVDQPRESQPPLQETVNQNQPVTPTESPFGSPQPEVAQPTPTPVATPTAPVNQSKGLAITSLILGILGFLTGFLGIGVLLGLIAVVLGTISLVKHKAGKGLAIAGLITGGIAFLFGGVLLAITLLAYGGIQERAKTVANKSAANTVLVRAEAFNATSEPSEDTSVFSNYPSYSELLSSTDPTTELDAVTKKVLHEGDAATVSETKPVAFTGCDAGVIVSYWDATYSSVEELTAGNPESC